MEDYLNQNSNPIATYKAKAKHLIKSNLFDSSDED
jgi:hypothetical protein